MISTPAKRTDMLLAVITAILLVICLFAPASAGPQPQAEPASAPPVIENAGQFGPGPRFLLNGGDARLWVADDGLWLVTVTRPQLSAEEQQLPLHRRARLLRDRPAQAAAVRLSFAGASFAGKLEPFGQVETTVNYLHGADPARWVANAPAWAGLRVRDLYPGIDLVIGAQPDGAPWRMDARPGADVSRVKLQVEGAAASAEGGRLTLATAAGTASLRLPALAGAQAGAAAVTPRGAQAAEVAAPFAPAGDAAAAPAGATDLQWATFVGGDGLEWPRGVAVDAAGNSYIVGDTMALNFPAGTGVFDAVADGAEAFVAKISADGKQLLYATYLGGSGFDFGWGIAVDGGNAYVVGDTDSQDFPAAGAGTVGMNDMFVVGLNADGTAATFSKLFGGSDSDYGYGVAVSGGAVYAVGSSASTDLTGWTSTGSGGGENAIAVKLTTAGAVSYRSKVGGNGLDAAYSVAVRNGEAFIAGESWSTDFPLAAGLLAGQSDAMLLRLNTTGGLFSSKLLGDVDDDFANGLALDGSGNVYVTGGTGSTAFPITAGQWAGGVRDAFVARFSSAWSLLFSTYVGGSGLEDGYAVAVDAAGNVYAAGETDSANFPATANAYDATRNGATGFDGFVTRLSPDAVAGYKLNYATYLGGAGADSAYGVAVAADGSLRVAGPTDSPDFPVTAGSFDTTLETSGASDAFVAKFVLPSPLTAPVLSIKKNVNDADLSWTAAGGAASYKLHRSLAPYFTPGDATSPTATYSGAALAYKDGGVCASLDNYYYVVFGVDGGGTSGPVSNRVGEFTFGLVKGQ